MAWQVDVGSEQVNLSPEAMYSGEENPGPEERMIRKAVGLPVTKQLVY